MVIHKIGSNTPANMENSLNRADDAVRVASNMNEQAANSSLVSMSQPQQDVSDFFNGVLYVLSLPFRPLMWLYNWIMGSSNSASAVSGSAARGNKAKRASGDGSEDLAAAFKKGEEFEVKKFKAAYANLSSEDKKAFKQIVWVVGNHDALETTGRDWVTKLLGKRELDEHEVDMLKGATQLFRSESRLQSLGERMETRGADMIADLEKEDSDEDFSKDAEKIEKDLRKLPKEVVRALARAALVFQPQEVLLTRKERESDDAEQRREYLGVAARGHAAQVLADGHYVIVGNTDARNELERMLRIIAKKGDTLSEGDFVREFRQLGTLAKKTFASVIGYMIGRPEDGEKYLMGTLKLDRENVVPNLGLLVVGLKNLVEHDGGAVPDSVARLRYGRPARDDVAGEARGARGARAAAHDEFDGAAAGGSSRGASAEGTARDARGVKGASFLGDSDRRPASRTDSSRRELSKQLADEAVDVRVSSMPAGSSVLVEVDAPRGQRRDRSSAPRDRDSAREATLQDGSAALAQLAAGLSSQGIDLSNMDFISGPGATGSADGSASASRGQPMMYPASRGSLHTVAPRTGGLGRGHSAEATHVQRVRGGSAAAGRASHEDTDASALRRQDSQRRSSPLLSAAALRPKSPEVASSAAGGGADVEAMRAALLSQQQSAGNLGPAAVRDVQPAAAATGAASNGAAAPAAAATAANA